MLERQPLLPLLERALGHRPSPPTIWRWINRGIMVGDDRVKLRTVRIGGKQYGTPEDVTAFIEAQNPPTVESDDGEYERSPETERQLQRAGLL